MMHCWRARWTDLLPLDDPAELKADLIDGVLGAGSSFDDTHGILVAGREKDIEFSRAAFKAQLVAVAVLRERLDATDLGANGRDRVSALLSRLSGPG
jgi:hypothetical protein